MKGSISDILKMVIDNPKPIIFIDTCALLDIVRAPIREDIPAENISTSIDLYNSKNIWLIASEIVTTEWNENVVEVERTTLNTIKNLHKNLLIFKNSVKNSPTPSKWNYNYEITSFDIEKVLKQVSSKLKGKLNTIKIDADCTHKAGMRVIKGLAPSNKGKSEFKDCAIIEHYLELALRLKANSFKNKLIFVTSNKNDYGTPYDIKEPLKTEFSDNKIHYVNNFMEAIKSISSPKGSASI